MSTLDKKDDHDLLADTITDWEENNFQTSSLTNGHPGGAVRKTKFTLTFVFVFATMFPAV